METTKNTEYYTNMFFKNMFGHDYDSQNYHHGHLGAMFINNLGQDTANYTVDGIGARVVYLGQSTEPHEYAWEIEDVVEAVVEFFDAQSDEPVMFVKFAGTVESYELGQFFNLAAAQEVFADTKTVVEYISVKP